MFLFVMIVVAFSGCRDYGVDADGNPNVQDDTIGVVEHDVPFEIGVGRSVNLDGSELSIEFSLVTEDNRCASDVVCIHPGRAGVLLTLTDHQGVRHQLISHIPGLVPTPYRLNDIIQFEGHRFRLLRLNPYPNTTDPTQNEEYLALIEIDRL